MTRKIAAVRALADAPTSPAAAIDALTAAGWTSNQAVTIARSLCY